MKDKSLIFKDRILDEILRSKEYKDLLNESCKKIVEGSKKAVNEATTVSWFEIEIYDILNESFGIKYKPEKEVLVETIRHKAKGRIDSKIGCLVQEFKHHSKLQNAVQIEKAIKQLLEYLEGLYKKEQVDYLGVLTDGVRILYIRLEDGKAIIESIKEIQERDIDRLIKSILSLNKVALTPKNLVKDFAEGEDCLARVLSRALFETLSINISEKTKVLFDEWKELFKLSHNDKSKQSAIKERKVSLEQTMQRTFNTVDEEYMAMFSLQTAYAIIIKIIAFKVISNIHYHNDMLKFSQLSSVTTEALKIKMLELEDGGIFKEAGLLNLLEGDFFSWYVDEAQWNTEIGTVIGNIFQILSKYEEKSLFNSGEEIQDLFKDLYQSIIPDKVRHCLGEFYTPAWLADNVVDNTLNRIKKQKWSGLDPCAGSGTFVTRMIARICMEHADNGEEDKTKILNDILSRVKGIDLNPLAVLTARINYFINISHLLKITDKFEIPIYLGDASYVPEDVEINGVRCIKYQIKTLQGIININMPLSALKNIQLFSEAISNIEVYIKMQDSSLIAEEILKLIDSQDKTDEILENIDILSKQLVDLENKHWDGIWARIIKNYLITSSLDKFDIIVGNPPWVDWKNLPSEYRDRIKTSVCIDNSLFSGAYRTGGINLNICALIANVCVNKWLAKDGVLGFLMPKSIIHQSSYEGFRNFKLNDGTRAYLQEIDDWTKAGHPFKPVTEKFLTYIYSREYVEYNEGIPVRKYELKRGRKLIDAHRIQKFSDIREWYNCDMSVAGTIKVGTTTFGYAENEEELRKFQAISGEAAYVGREGIEFYPQELFLLEILDMPATSEKLVAVKNYQGDKSKHKVPPLTRMLEKKFIHPLVKGKDIQKFHWDAYEYVVPFPYKKGSKIPIAQKELVKIAPNLHKYMLANKNIILQQTDYNEKIINNDDAEFYALARVGEYTYGEYSVGYRDNTKWQASVIEPIDTSWGEKILPLFQNHAVSITQDSNGNFITKEEAHYICAILNAPIVRTYMMKSSDSRSFKIRVPVKLEKYDAQNSAHKKLAELSINAHLAYDNTSKVAEIEAQIDKIYLALCGYLE
ncbi:hypothetical protein CS063_14085 [Sporanaerobium hydrogeniformans]|uniref:Uncharacterized protein n=1 Tax=Sporanaerobium hydrogeniformans TaxID=3072179 RepID=A0AC61D9G9_9FIRM|nr:hypothetical protein [Sporanaerobium hydrogeniformans]PHV69723.1 hypothetical protein CS063_14085 [Sporanaerobium hydrogeniformans]